MLKKPEMSVKPLRSVTQRRGLPSGRALLGALLVTLAGLGAFLLATANDGAPTTSFLVLDEDVAAGEFVSAAAVSLEPMELSVALVATSLTTTEGLEGATALRDLRRGELLSVHDLVAAPVVEGEPLVSIHEITFGIPLDRTPVGLMRGDRVTVLGTTADVTIVAAEDASVLAIQTSPDGIGGTGYGTLTLAIADAGSVLRVAHITQTSELTIVRSTRAIDDVYPESIRVSEQSDWPEQPNAPMFGSPIDNTDPAGQAGPHSTQDSASTTSPFTTADSSYTLNLTYPSDSTNTPIFTNPTDPLSQGPNLAETSPASSSGFSPDTPDSPPQTTAAGSRHPAEFNDFVRPNTHNRTHRPNITNERVDTP